MPKLNILLDYNPENKCRMLNFMDVLNLCEKYEQVKSNLMQYNDSHTFTTNPLCKQKGTCSETNQCLYCCKNSEEHLIGIYKDIKILKGIGKKHQSNFIKNLFGENFPLPDVPITIIASFMNKQELPLPSVMEPNSYPYILESDEELSLMYIKYSHIFALLQYACNPMKRKISKEIFEEVFHDQKIQHFSLSQILCGCDKIRWPLEENSILTPCRPNTK